MFKKPAPPESPRTNYQTPRSSLAESRQPTGESVTQAQPAQTSAKAGVANQPNSEGEGSKLIVGPNIKLKGSEITDCDILVVEGRVEVSMNSRVIQIAQGGVFSGKAEIDVAEVRGHFEGELTARKRLIVHATGKVMGTIRYGSLMIEEGGVLSGNVEATPAATPIKSESAGGKPADSAAAAQESNGGQEDKNAGVRPAWLAATR